MEFKLLPHDLILPWLDAVQAVKAEAETPKDLSRLLPEQFRAKYATKFIDELRRLSGKSKESPFEIGLLIFYIDAASLYAFQDYKSLNDLFDSGDFKIQKSWAYKINRVYETFIWRFGLDDPKNPYHDTLFSIESFDFLVTLETIVTEETYGAWLELAHQAEIARDDILTQQELAMQRRDEFGENPDTILPLETTPPRKMEIKEYRGKPLKLQDIPRVLEELYDMIDQYPDFDPDIALMVRVVRARRKQK